MMRLTLRSLQWSGIWVGLCFGSLVWGGTADCPSLLAHYFGDGFEAGGSRAGQIRASFKSLIPSVGTASTEILTRDEFEAIFRGLEVKARAYGIQLKPKTETVGVFPEGMALIGISGFGHITSNEAPNFAARHELAHLIHTIELRAYLVESLGKSTISELSPAELASANARLKTWEDGIFNYAEFEKMVGRASSVIHTLRTQPVLEARKSYFTNLAELVDGTALIVDSGRVRFPNHWDLEGTYAWFLSRAPFIVGRSAGELAARMPILFFTVAYAANLDLESYLKGLKFPKGYRGRRSGFRDWVNAWATESTHHAG